MSIKIWVKTFNDASAGSDTQKNVLRLIAENKKILFIEDIGFIHHNTKARNQFSYGVGSKQMIIRDENGKVCERISFGKITSMEVMSNENFEYIKLTVTK